MKENQFEEFTVFGRYQKRLAFLLMLSTIPNAFTSFQFLYVQYQPKYHCNIPPEILNNHSNISNSDEEYLLNLTVPWTAGANGQGVRSKCYNYYLPDNYTELNVTESSSKAKCRSWKFEKDGTSAITEFELVCEKAWLHPVMTSLYMGGKLCGGLFGGLLSDRFGRKTVFLAFSAWQYLATIALSFTSSIPVYGFIMFLCGCGGLVNFMVAVLLATEMTKPSKRSYMFFFVQLGFSTGYMLLPAVGYFFRDWRWFLRFTGLIGVLYIPYFWLLDESPRWLASVGRVQEAKTVLLKIAKENKTHINTDKIDVTMKMCKTSSVDGRFGLIKSLKTIIVEPVILKRMLIIFFAWFSTSLMYYVIGLNTNSLSGNRFLNAFLIGLMDFVANLAHYFMTEKIGRRNLYMMMTFIMAILTAVTPFIANWNTVAVIIAVSISKFLDTVAFDVLYVYTGELFPTAVRNSAVGAATATSRIGSMAAPYVLFAGDPVSTIAASFVMGVVILISCALFAFLPKTLNVPLPQTTQEAVLMKKSKNIRLFKYCSKNGNKEETTI